MLGGNSNSSSSAGSSIINGILNNVIGSGTFSKQDLCAHTWKYSKPGCAFTSENLLAKAGGEIAANKVEEKLGEYYSKFGFSGSNTYFTFKTDGTFAAKIDGKSWQGNYTFDEDSCHSDEGIALEYVGLCYEDYQRHQPALRPEEVAQPHQDHRFPQG